jgi:hypothetical protein
MSEFQKIVEFERVIAAAGEFSIEFEYRGASRGLFVKAKNRPEREFISVIESTDYINGLIDGIESVTCGSDE